MAGLAGKWRPQSTKKANAKFYDPVLSGREMAALRWWANAILNLTPWHTRERPPRSDLKIYTNAEKTTQIIAAVLIDTRSFRATLTTSAVISAISAKVGTHWGKLLGETCEIYGLEMLEIFAILFDPLSALTGMNIVFFVGNNNSLEALVSNAP